MKVEEATPDKPEIAILARKLGVSVAEAFLNWFRLYRWAGRVTTDGFVRSVSVSDADILSGARPGTCNALGSSDIGWIEARSDGLQFVKWDRHNSKSAKARALDAAAKRSRRENVLPESGCEPDSGRTRREETRGENQSSKDEWKTNGSAISQDHASQSSRSSRSFFRDGRAADLSEIDWDRVVVVAESIGRRLPPRNEQDRRTWLRFGVLEQTTFSEAWIHECIEAAMTLNVKRSKRALFVAALKTKAREQNGIDDEAFVTMLRSIEIPTEVWKLEILEIRE